METEPRAPDPSYHSLSRRCSTKKSSVSGPRTPKHPHVPTRTVGSIAPASRCAQHVSSRAAPAGQSGPRRPPRPWMRRLSPFCLRVCIHDEEPQVGPVHSAGRPSRGCVCVRECVRWPLTGVCVWCVCLVPEDGQFPLTQSQVISSHLLSALFFQLPPATSGGGDVMQTASCHLPIVCVLPVRVRVFWGGRGVHMLN